jgi:hypothetical protein
MIHFCPPVFEAHYSLGSFLCFENPEEALWELEMAIALDAEGDVAQRAKNTIKVTQLKKRLRESL